MGGSQAKVQTNTAAACQYDLKIIPSKVVYTQDEDIAGQVILDLKKPFTRPGILVVSLDGKEQFEYVPYGHKSNHIHRNENKFVREREILHQFNNIPVGRHIFNFNLTIQNTQKIPPSVSIYQEIKGHGVLDLSCSYKLGVTIYDTSNRVDKIDKVEFPILIKEQPQKNPRVNFIEMGQSEVLSCLVGLGSGGICSFQVKCPKDNYQDDETIYFQGKIDNSRSRSSVKKAEVKLVRYIRLHTLAYNQTSSYDIILTQELFKAKYSGIGIRSRDLGFNREYSINLDQVFTKERAEFRTESLKDSGLNGIEKLCGFSPSALGKTFMIHYAIQVSLKHPGLFSQPTSLEIDINVELSRKDQIFHENHLNQVREKSNRRLLNGP